jgi:pyruvate formate lyase activating enzyme
MSKSRETATLSSAAMPDQLAQACVQTGSRSIAFTYNDPVIFHEYAIDVAQACREAGIQSVAVTAGYMNAAPRAEFFRHMDAANIDLKAFNEKFYHEVCGAHLNTILDTLEHVRHDSNTWLEITTLLIPGENDDPHELQAMTRWIHDHLGPDVPLHFTAFHPDWKMRDKSHTPANTLTLARRIARDNGLNYVYVGNVHDRDASSTWCPQCNTLLIERDWYRLGEFNILDGRCVSCGSTIAGHFDNTKGDWGAQRVPVRFVD